mmetsp:Transcript_33433/g.106679  ORF Transcript_33433/g.106679 Transcript_33433/m.106679 type:complete len:212 (-) Transcript_33433:504-1139(-)
MIPEVEDEADSKPGPAAHVVVNARVALHEVQVLHLNLEDDPPASRGCIQPNSGVDLRLRRLAQDVDLRGNVAADDDRRKVVRQARRQFPDRHLVPHRKAHDLVSSEAQLGQIDGPSAVVLEHPVHVLAVSKARGIDLGEATHHAHAAHVVSLAGLQAPKRLVVGEIQLPVKRVVLRFRVHTRLPGRCRRQRRTRRDELRFARSDVKRSIRL